MMEMQEVAENMFIRLPGLPLKLIVKAEGVYLYTSTGEKLIDASSGPMAAGIGHGRAEIADAAAASIKTVSYVLPVFATEARIELTKRIKRRMPPELCRIYFCSGGSEANEAAIKFARQYHVVAGRPERTQVITREHCYHGNTMLMISVSGIEERRRDFRPMLWTNPRVADCYCYRCSFGGEYPRCDLECAHDLEEKILAAGPDTVAAFLAEPIVASATGANAPPPEYWPLAREVCDRYGVALMVDEVVTGFGRTGRNMGMDHYGVVPDVSVFAKGVSGGYAPLAGMAVRESMVKTFEDKGEEFQSLYTYSAHPLACAIGNKVQEIIDREDLIARADRMGAYLGRRLERLRELPIVGDIRGRGLLWAVELVKNKKTREPFPPEVNLKMRIVLLGTTQGVFLYPGYYRDAQGRGDHIMLAPPYIVTEDQIDQIVAALEWAIRESIKGLERD
jgi:adenosylmethionine-8-amino-7-oxononanoate aminotransferase